MDRVHRVDRVQEESLPRKSQSLKRRDPLRRSMATKYCEFEPSQHRNKRVALLVFLDHPGDPHPLAICDVCAKKLKQMRPDAIVRDRKEFEADRKAARKAAAAPGKKDDAEGEDASAPPSDVPGTS